MNIDKLDKGFEFYVGLEEAKNMKLKNIDVEYNECGGYIDGYDINDEQVQVCHHDDSDEMFDVADDIIKYLEGN